MKILTLSSERFKSATLNETIMDNIDKAKQIFFSISKKPPTLEEALKAMGYDNAKDITEVFIKKAREKMAEFEGYLLTIDEIATIFCYTSEWDPKEFGEIESPCKMLNNSLCVDRSNPVLRKTNCFLFLLLQALRKLPRHVPDNHFLYKGVRARVDTESTPKLSGMIPYAVGNEKIWWGFASTTENMKASQDLIGENEGTLFMVGGDVWGYNISAFSDFPEEEEILLEPERRMSITNVSTAGKIVTVSLNMLDTPLVLDDIIKVATPLDVKERAFNIKDVPKNLKVESITYNSVRLSWTPLPVKDIVYQVAMKRTDTGLFNRNIETVYEGKEAFYVMESLDQNTEYEFRVCCGCEGKWGKWSDKVDAKTKMISWKLCPETVDFERKYVLDENCPRIAAKLDNLFYCSTLIGDLPLPANKVTSWNIKMLRSRNNNGDGILIGVAPADIDQNVDDNFSKCGWYFSWHTSTLWSGRPQKYADREYGPRKGRDGEYISLGNTVGISMDTTSGDLSFVLNDVSLGVAYDKIPLDKPLVPCVLLWNRGDMVELDTTGVKENVDSTIPAPSGITTKSTTWDAITLKWNPVDDVTFYQIETDGSKFRNVTITNAFTKRGLLPDTEHSFRVRAVRGNFAGEWSSVAKHKTEPESFEISAWKEYPDDGERDRKYVLDEDNPRIATNVGRWTTIVGNTPVPLNTLTLWSIKVLRSEENDGYGIFLGIAPAGVKQNDYANFSKSGWFFDCYDSTLRSGHPHNYWNKPYGPRKKSGMYVRTRDTVGLSMDTTKGELSFVVNDVNLGAAYEGISLDRPLVPCVLLVYEGDSVEFDISEAKENVNNFISIPANVTAKSSTWESITLTWDSVDGSSFYQVEMDGKKILAPTNIITRRGLKPDTEYVFRIRTARGSSVSGWSEPVKGRTQKESFETSWWKECPSDIDANMRYAVNELNFKVAKRVGEGLYKYCTIIGTATLPPSRVNSWNVKILESVRNDGQGIFVGVAPADINQGDDDNRNKCGWYYDCYNSSLFSGPPHSYKGKEYGPRKRKGKYVRAGDSVGVVMDMVKGEASFTVSGVNYGVAYTGIPIDKPLVPCVFLRYQNDTVELDISKVEDNINNSIPIPCNIIARTITWDTIFLSWGTVDGASFYQIEIDGSNSWDTATTGAFTKRGFLPDTDHTFRVRAVKGNVLSAWSDFIRVRTPKEYFETSWWKDCPEDVDPKMKYSIYERNFRVATMMGASLFKFCTIIGTTPVPPNRMTAWGIQILKSQENASGFGIYVGVAPSDINQGDDDNFNKCGWYIDCANSTLFSGPPHNYMGEPYGPMRWYGQFTRMGDTVGVILDTMKGELSFVLDNVNYGPGYMSIPLNKPLVPCVLLRSKGDSVVLLI